MKRSVVAVLAAIGVLAGPGTAGAELPEYVPGSFWHSGTVGARCGEAAEAWTCDVAFSALSCTDGAPNYPSFTPSPFSASCGAELAAVLPFRAAAAGTGCVADQARVEGTLRYVNFFVVPPGADIPVTVSYAAGMVTATASRYRPAGSEWTYDVTMQFPFDCRGTDHTLHEPAGTTGFVLATYDGWVG